MALPLQGGCDVKFYSELHRNINIQGLPQPRRPIHYNAHIDPVGTTSKRKHNKLLLTMLFRILWVVQ